MVSSFRSAGQGGTLVETRMLVHAGQQANERSDVYGRFGHILRRPRQNTLYCYRVPPRVLFVSKPIAPPWHDGSKNLVRDIASHLGRAEPTVLSTPDAPALGRRVRMEPVYRDPGRFAPALLANARVVRRLLVGDPHDVWHFVFAPNPVSSAVAQLALRTRRTTGWRGKVAQTVASAPESFESIGRWIFGDIVVALSEWTRGRLLGAGVPARAIRVIPPCAAAPAMPSPERRVEMRARLAVGEAPIVLYPGDYEISRGAQTVAAAVARIVARVPEARVVFACRPKTKGSAAAGERIKSELERVGLLGQTRHVGEVEDMPALLASTSVVAFPVDDLYGKVDVPLVLLEALALGVPMVLASGGPLESIRTARFVEPADSEAVAREVTDLLRSPPDPSASTELHARRFAPSVVAAAHDELYEELAAS
jgi:phosphatidylinositol alpha-1,6-mannosyltransferase